MKRKKQDCPIRSLKTHISAVSVSEMAADQQAIFEGAVDVLLADLIHRVDRPKEGNLDEYKSKSMAGQGRHHRGAPKR